jgi:hypothetical protein
MLMYLRLLLASSSCSIYELLSPFSSKLPDLHIYTLVHLPHTHVVISLNHVDPPQRTIRTLHLIQIRGARKALPFPFVRATSCVQCLAAFHFHSHSVHKNRRRFREWFKL